VRKIILEKIAFRHLIVHCLFKIERNNSGVGNERQPKTGTMTMTTTATQELRDFFFNGMMSSCEIGSITHHLGWMDEEMLQATPSEILSAYLFSANDVVDSWIANVRDTPDEGDNANHAEWQAEQIAKFESMRPRNKRLAELRATFAGV
jgi:hypothetical protein